MQKGSFPSETSLFISGSPEETIAAGERIGLMLNKGDVVALSAPLGAGKTVFVKGIARALGVEDTITSPSYTIISEYQGKTGLFYHIDAYRLSGCADFIEIGGEEILFGEGICIVEWSERIAELLPVQTINITIRVTGAYKREIVYENSN
jgi:tRNA threonylcarbamoyladenosine biosynthesis protein TsaE